ncbi:MAG: hypothetical protein M5R36_05790 [Deltaproteobacteria bacterium]|nr:hypothetical protein [Deltaproteobacteria bacterium]
MTTALDRPRELFGPAGAAAFWDRACLDELARGGMIFDEDMIDGLLDFDVAWRARWLGHRFWYNPGAFVLHNRGVLYTNHEERRREHEFLPVAKPSAVLPKKSALRRLAAVRPQGQRGGA